MKEKIISFDSVSYMYPGENNPAVAEVSIDVFSGEFLAVLGHNGSGKSTFAKLINGLLTPVDGDVRVCGLSTADDQNVWQIRSRAGMVFQNPDNQMVSSIVEEDVAFGPENLRIPPPEIRTRVDEALSSVRMSGFAQSAPHMLSGGQKQRVAIAGVLAMHPDIIILDEPTAMLDPVGRAEVQSTMLRLHKEGITIVWITHFMEEAALADRICVMDDGKIALLGKPEEVFAKANELRSLGLDIPEVTEIARGLNEKGVDIPRDIITEESLVEHICRLLQIT